MKQSFRSALVDIFKKEVGETRHAAARSLVGRRAGASGGKSGGKNEDAKEAATAEHLQDDINRTLPSRCWIDEWVKLTHGDVVIAAITSCTNTSNPSVMIAAGLLAKKAVEKGLRVPPYVKTSLAPGSRVVTDYFEQGRADAVSRSTRLQDRRLWLHDLHRQQRPAARGDRQGGREGRSGRRGGAVGQSQFRRAHQSAREGQLSGQPAAGGGVCAGRHRSMSNLMDEPLGQERQGRAGLSPRHLADAGRK